MAFKWRRIFFAGWHPIMCFLVEMKTWKSISKYSMCSLFLSVWVLPSIFFGWVCCGPKPFEHVKINGVKVAWLWNPPSHLVLSPEKWLSRGGCLCIATLRPRPLTSDHCTGQNPQHKGVSWGFVRSSSISCRYRAYRSPQPLNRQITMGVQYGVCLRSPTGSDKYQPLLGLFSIVTNHKARTKPDNLSQCRHVWPTLRQDPNRSG